MSFHTCHCFPRSIVGDIRRLKADESDGVEEAQGQDDIQAEDMDVTTNNNVIDA